MKKLLVTILAFIYLTTTTGATVHVHYCMGKLVSWSFWEDKEDKCSVCGMAKAKTLAKGCCTEEHKQFKSDKDQKLTETTFYLNHASAATHSITHYELPAATITFLTETNPVSNAPPRSQVAIHIRNCVFRI